MLAFLEVTAIISTI